MVWDWPHLRLIGQHVEDILSGKYKRLLVSMPPQHGKPVYNGSMILTAAGERKRIDQISVGDYVITHRGRPRRVEAVHVQGDRECVRIYTELGRETVAALDHPFLTPNGWVEAGNLTAGDTLGCVSQPQTQTSEHTRPVEMFRLAGYFIGDGCATRWKDKSSSATITSKDPGIQSDLFVVATACGFKCTQGKHYPKKCPYYNFSSGVRPWLEESGIAGCNSHTKRVPDWVFRGSHEQVANFLGAYYDCDGTLSGRGLARNGGIRKDPCIEYNSVSKLLLQDTQHLLLRLGIRSRLTAKNGVYKGSVHHSWRLAITSVDDASKFASRIPLKGERGERLKAAAVLQRGRFDPQYIEDKIKTVERVGLMPCRCLTVNEDHTFTSDDLVVHNSTAITHRLPLYLMSTRRGFRVGLGSYNTDYAEYLSRYIQKCAESAGIKLKGKKTAAEWELPNGSSLYAFGIGKGVTGRPLDFAIIDDPVKDREEADSEAMREKAWDWWADSVKPRLQEGSPTIAIMTRWHTDDLGGRWLDREKKLWHYLTLPAIAEENDVLGRKPGEPLCPARFSLETLIENRTASPETFEALYQQNPVPRGGSLFKSGWFKSIIRSVRLNDRARRIRYWDLAGTKKETSKWTSGVLLAFDGRNFMIEDVQRFRETPAERNELMRQTAEMDAKLPGFYRTYFEEQPGAAGVETSDNMIRYLRGFAVEADRVTGDKATRAEPVATAFRGGMIQILEGHWNRKLIDELCLFPRGSYSDQVDSLSGAYNKLAKGPAAIAV